MTGETILIEQPNYIPWLGYFDLVDRSDVCVWYDCVQYTKRDWRNRNKIAAGAESVWLTVPVVTKGRFEQRICDVEIDRSVAWAKKHLASFDHAYARAPFHGLVRELYAKSILADHRFLADMTIELDEAIARLLGSGARFVRSSKLEGVSGAKQERLLSVCDQFDCDVYLSGPSAKAYIDVAGFAARGYAVHYIVYDYDRYDRVSGARDENLSILDTLVHLGPQGTLELMRRRRKTDVATSDPRT